MGPPRLEALKSGTVGEVRLKGLGIETVDTDLNSVREDIAPHPRTVDHDFMLDCITPPMPLNSKTGKEGFSQRGLASLIYAAILLCLLRTGRLTRQLLMRHARRTQEQI